MEIETKVKQTAGKQVLRAQVVDVNRLSSHRIELSAKDIDNTQSSHKGENNTNENLLKICLEGVWTHGHIVKNTVLHLVNPLYNDATITYTINNSNGLLVINPDDLLTCTLVASSLFCERKTWLNNVFLGQVGTNKAMLVGTLVHEVFQYAVNNKITQMDKLTKYLDEQLDSASVMMEIYSVELHIKDIRSEAINYLKSVQEWVERFMLNSSPQPLDNNADIEVKVIGICDIEENVWSTKYGLKGKIDVTGAVRVYDKQNKKLKDTTLPLELKTGNPNLSSSHAAQVGLYSMMIEDRYAETNQGLVIYLKDKAAMHNVTLTHNIKRDLVQRRNQINYHMKSSFFGPEMIDQQRMCKNCERLTECILMSKLYKPDEIDHYPSMKSLQQEAIGHLDDKFMSFFRNYHEKLTSLISNANDSGDVNLKATSSFWTYSSDEAETRGTGYGKLRMVTSDKGLVTFKRDPECKENFLKVVETIDLSDSEPTIKKQRIDQYFKPKVVKERPKLKPFDTKHNFTRCRIAISLDQEVSNLDSQNSSTALAIGFMHDIKDDHIVLRIFDGAASIIKPDATYRVDKIEKKASFDIERIVLDRLLTREDYRCDRIRHLILNPKYESSDDLEVNMYVLEAGFEEIAELDAEYQELVVDAVSTENYYIINELSVDKKKKLNKILSVIARTICSLKRTVLIVARTMNDLKDILHLLRTAKAKFILIDGGKSAEISSRYSSNIVKLSPGDHSDLIKRYDSYIKQQELPPVVVTTYAMSAACLLFTRRVFDYCIAMDCDKTELLLSLAPMFCCHRQVIVDVRETQQAYESYKDENVTLGDHLRSFKKRL